MLDNELIELFLPVINAGLVARGFAGVAVKQAYQPTQQGAVSTPVVYFSKVGDRRLGWVDRENVFDDFAQEMEHTEAQCYETTFQFNAYVVANPGNPSYTASDLCNTVAQILQADSTLQTFATVGVGVLRIGDVRNIYFVDDRDRHEASPSFDIVFTHKQIFTNVDPVVSSVDYAIYPI